MLASKFASNIEKEMMKKIGKEGLKAGAKYYIKHMGKGFLADYVKGMVVSSFINIGINAGLYRGEVGYNYFIGNV